MNVTSHRRFALLNRVANPWVRWLLTSPLHGLLSERLALITVTGRRTGHEHTFPVGYTRHGELVTVRVGWPERKRWWRNLEQTEQPVQLRLAGVERSGRASLHGDETAGMNVDVRLDPIAGDSEPTRAAPSDA